MSDNKCGLIVDPAFYDLSPLDKATICNGMGPKLELLGVKVPNLVPNRFYGLDVSICGDIHDYGYYVGGTEKDRERVDSEFYANMVTVIKAANGGIPVFSSFIEGRRIKLAYIYWEAVSHFGRKFFNYHADPCQTVNLGLDDTSATSDVWG